MSMRCSSVLKARLFVLILLSFVIVGCTTVKTTGAAITSTPSPVTLTREQAQAQQWIQQHAVTLATTDPTAPLDDLQALISIVGNKTIVGLGEATHGTHEFFTMKHRILEYLVEKLGFTTFAMEGSWSAGLTINDYVVNGTGTAIDALSHFLFWTWNTQEMLDLIQWMRAYDADPAHTVKVHFAGFDCQLIELPTFDGVIQYIQQVDPADRTQIATLYANLHPLANDIPTINKFWQTYDALPLATRQQYATQAQEAYTLLTAHQAQDVAHSSAQAYAVALQDARVIVQGMQLLTFSQTGDLTPLDNYRDAAMAENVGWLAQHGAGKLVLWAHDAHIGAAPYEPGYITMGMHLRQQFGANYLTILTSFYQGTFNAIPYRYGEALANLGPNQLTSLPIPDSYNQVLGSLSTPNYLLDLTALPPSGPVQQWFAGPHEFIEIGATFDASQLVQSAYVPLELAQAADVVISLHQTTSTQLLPFA